MICDASYRKRMLERLEDALIPDRGHKPTAEEGQAAFEALTRMAAAVFLANHGIYKDGIRPLAEAIEGFCEEWLGLTAAANALDSERS